MDKTPIFRYFKGKGDTISLRARLLGLLEEHTHLHETRIIMYSLLSEREKAMECVRLENT